MTITIANVRDSIAAAVVTTGLRCYSYLGDSINAPCAYVAPLEFDPRLVFSGVKTEYQFQIRVYATRAAAVEQNQKLMDGYRETSGTTSLTAAIQNSANWSAAVDYAQVTRVGEVQVVDYGGAPYMYLELDVEVCW